jgi:HSP20 family protein
MFPLIRSRPERALARASPFWNLREDMENLFAGFPERWGLPEEWAETREWEFEENEKEVVMRLPLPGFEISEFELRVEGNVFVVKAVHPEGEIARPGHRPGERYEYRFVMPFGTDAAHVEAIYRNGILELHLPRLPEATPRRVEVKT